MGKQAKRAYLEAIRGRYRKAKQADKTKILDEFCAVCGYNRKYAIRLLGRKKSTSQPRRVGRKAKYAHPQLIEALELDLADPDLDAARSRIVGSALAVSRASSFNGLYKVLTTAGWKTAYALA